MANYMVTTGLFILHMNLTLVTIPIRGIKVHETKFKFEKIFKNKIKKLFYINYDQEPIERY